MVPSYTTIKELLRRLCHHLIIFTIAGRGQAPEKVTTTDLYYLRNMDERTVNVPYLLARDGSREAIGWSCDRAAPVDPEVAKEGVQADQAPGEATQAPQAVAPAVRTMPQRIQRLDEEVHELCDSIV
nr:hypothetical protein [Tanacetum cinerariifolium]